MYKCCKSVHNLTEINDEAKKRGGNYGKEAIITKNKKFLKEERILHYYGGMFVGNSGNDYRNGLDK